MLLFCDGFENFDVFDLWRKWGHVKFNRPISSVDGSYSNPDAKIVSGDDATVNPIQPRARHGRALAYRNSIVLGTPIDKSRSVFVGFALRARIATTVRVTFISSCPQVRSSYALFPRRRLYETATNINPGDCNFMVAECIMSIKSDRIDCVWTFYNTLLPKQYTQVISNTKLLSGDWYYYQLGTTVTGSDVNNPQGWVENRIGNRPNKRCRVENIRTTISNDLNSYYINGVALAFSHSSSTLWNGIDDVYIANDEGSVNNDFLGNISIRNSIPVAEGVQNDSEPHGGNTLYRMEHVRYGDDGIVRTMLAPTVPVVDGEPLAVGEDPRQSYLRLLEDGDCQLLRFTHNNYAGSEPNIVAVAITAMTRSVLGIGLPGQLRPTVRVGDSMLYGRPPLLSPPPAINVYDVSRIGDGAGDGMGDYNSANNKFFVDDASLYGFHAFQFFIENDGASPSLWSTTAVNNAEYGFTLQRLTSDHRDVSIYSDRKTVVVDEVVNDTLNLYTYSSRHLEVQLNDSFEMSIPTTYADWGASISVGFVLADDSIPARGFAFFCEEHLYSKDEFRMDFVNIDEFMSFEDSNVFAWTVQANDEVFTYDWTTPWICEQVVSVLTSVPASYGAVATLVGDGFSISPTDIWDGHFDAVDIIDIDVSYIFSGHELAEEYVDLESEAINGVGLSAFDGIVLIENHHDGWWVELRSDDVSLSVDIKTQQWRHEWFMGVIIRSWQIEPIEQPGATDGNRVGDLDPDIFG